MLILLFSTPASAQQWYELNWKEWTSRKDFFTVSFPGEPTETESKFTTEYQHSLPARVYSYQAGPNRFSITVVDYTNLEKMETERVAKCPSDGNVCQNIYLYDMRGAYIYALWNIIKRGGKTTVLTYARTNLVEGLEVYIDSPDGSRVVAAAFMHANRLYILEAVAPGEAPVPTLFYQSFAFLDANGVAIRYRTPYANGLTKPEASR
jgi:hypothetical protein